MEPIPKGTPKRFPRRVVQFRLGPQPGRHTITMPFNAFILSVKQEASEEPIVVNVMYSTADPRKEERVFRIYRTEEDIPNEVPIRYLDTLPGTGITGTIHVFCE